MSDQSDAAAMIVEEGQAVTIVGTSSTVYDPATSTVTPTPYSKASFAALFPLNPYRWQHNSDVAAGDEQALLSGLDSAGQALPKPPLASTFTFANGAIYTLIAISPLHPGGTDLLFDCAVRGH